MNKTVEMWKAWAKEKQEAKGQRRKDAPELLTKAGIPFTTHNQGAHLILDTHLGFVDFWPGTAKWKTRTFPEQKGHGITRLLHLIQPEFAK
jgi:hypothetical protein